MSSQRLLFLSCIDFLLMHDLNDRFISLLRHYCRASEGKTFFTIIYEDEDTEDLTIEELQEVIFLSN